MPDIILDAEKDDSFPWQPKKYMMLSHFQRNTFYLH